MIDEYARKKLALEHSRLLSAGDLDGLMRLYGDDVTFEDPVGAGTRTGREALRAHLAEAVAAGVRETAGEPVAGQDGRHALVPVTAVMDYAPRGPGYARRGWLAPPEEPDRQRLRCEYMLMIQTGPGGLIRSMRAYWGRSDITVLDAEAGDA
ncbi:nuclear transport factor 2 family protein [Phytohabitans houttuyneae]|uniref:SnoaL-like domain-containing protein n=1 Tax=Phytohabitans houttuyneae TaxID=1076126 RepID=A0A6V8K6H0_9ACTN|nr:nuclear transport factor 2 family protein [Phytohabitans houttuyneae]GFJ80793.1 hypothetical protein Phou_049730 [Phytohabitans houttuyneae]